MQARDASALGRLLADGFLGTDRQGTVYSKASFLANPARHIPDRIEAVRFVTQPGDGVVIVTGTHVETRGSVRQPMVFTRVWSLTDRGAQLISSTEFVHPQPSLVPGMAATNAPSTTAPPTTPASQPIRVGGAVLEPKKLRDVRPAYPDEARAANVTGIVIMEAVIDENGVPGGIRVLRGHPMLDQAAIDAVQQWRYTPTLLNGAPVPVIMTVTINFSLQSSLEPQPLRIGGNVKPPEKLVHVDPVYPAIAQAAGVSAVVILETTIDPTGTPTEIRVLRGHPMLDQAAIDAVQQWRFQPVLLNGNPVSVIGTFTVNFGR
jgi:TonB family protein